MKRTNLVAKLVSYLLFIAMVAYLGVYIVQALSKDIRTLPAVYLSLSDSINLTGAIIRDEEYIESNEQHLIVNSESGKMLAAGETVAVLYSSEAALERAGQIHELELKQQYISSVLEDTADTSSEKKGVKIQNAIITLAAAAARHDMEQISPAALNLSALLLDQSDINASEVDLKTVQDQLFSLKQTAARDSKSITASGSGIFSSSNDGYEFLSYENLSGISASELISLTKEPGEIPENAFGKIVFSNAWYYVAVIRAEDAALLNIGDSCELDFNHYYSQPISGKVVSISGSEDGKCVAFFRCTSALSEMLLNRFADAEIVYNTHSGLRVPKEASYLDDGGAYVYTAAGPWAEKKYINILRETEDYYLVEASTEDNALAENSDIIITSKDIYDGMLLT